MFHAVSWMKTFWEYLIHISPDFINRPCSEELSWLRGLGEAAIYMRGSTSTELKLCMTLLDFGRRRARNFLSKRPGPVMQPFFGLCNPPVMAALSEDIDVNAGVRYLREISQGRMFIECEGLICFVQELDGIVYYEYATAIPHERKTDKRLHDGTTKTELIHARWIGALAFRARDRKLEPLSAKVSTLGCLCKDLCEPSCTCLTNGKWCGALCHQKRTCTCTNTFHDKVDLKSRQDSIVASGEVCMVLDHSQRYRDPEGSSSSTLYWDDPPIVFQQRECQQSESAILPVQPASSCHCFELRSAWPTNVSSGSYQYCERKWESCILSRVKVEKMTGFILYVIERQELGMTQAAYVAAAAVATKTFVKPETGMEWLKSGSANKTRIWEVISVLRWQKGHALQKLPEIFSTPKGLNWDHSKYHTSTMIISAHKPPYQWFRSLEALSTAAHIYTNFDGTSVSLKVISYPLHQAHWIPTLNATDYPVADHNLYSPSWNPESSSNLILKMQRENTFACIAMFESGSLNIRPSDLHAVLALCSDNSIFVAGVLLSDPSISVEGCDVRHIVGNIGHAGMTMMISPDKPRIRPLSDNYNIVQHAAYDFKREDNFGGTSLHLSFTEWKLALSTGAMGVIDQEVHFLESVVSLWDYGQWVADLDVIALEKCYFRRILGACSCGSPMNSFDEQELISLDSWEELLDPPGTTGILRAHGNWAARLAAVALLIQKKDSEALIVLGNKTPCWKCLVKRRDLSEFIVD
jgi:hypothetical protein